MKLITTLTLVAATACLASCGKPESPKDRKPSLSAYRMVEEKNLRARLKDPDSMILSGEFMSDNASGSPTLCGYVNSRNSLGGMTGPQRFIAGAIVGIEEDFAPGEMDKAWAMLCAQPIEE